jgi:cell division protein FtsL
MMRTNRLAVTGLFVLAALITTLGVRHVAHRRDVVRLGYQLSSATAELRRLEEDNRRLRLETSVLTHPARIERLAGSLGLIRPAPEQIRVVRSAALARGTSAGPAGAAAGAERSP